MPRHVYPVVSAGAVIFVSAAVTLGTNGGVLAGSECIEQPGREPTQGARWHYHYDREKNRKCWHLEVDTTKTHEAVPPLKDQSNLVAPPPTISSAFSRLFRGVPTGLFTSTPQDATVGEPRIIQSNPTKPLRIEDIAPQQPDIPEERAEPRYETPLTPAQRQALFEEYLRWEEMQRSLGALGIPARSP